MFTGLIRELGDVTSLRSRSGGGVLSLKSDEVAPTANIGDSIAVNGVCLTVTEKNGKVLFFDLSGETLQSTNIGNLKPGSRVNLEPSLSPDAKIGGHFVTGHVDSVGEIRSKIKIGDMLKVEIVIPKHLMDFLVEKGSIAVDGISLTIVDILTDGFRVVIIPHTIKMTTIGIKGAGDTVNIEADILGKYVARFLKRDTGRDAMFMKSLAEGGYLNR